MSSAWWMPLQWLADGAVALLLLASGVLVLLGAIGVLRWPTFYQRMHAASVIPTAATWCVALASIIHFSSAHSEGLVLHQLVVLLLLAITVPVSTMLLMRAAIFRGVPRDGVVSPPDAVAAAEAEPASKYR